MTAQKEEEHFSLLLKGVASDSPLGKTLQYLSSSGGGTLDHLIQLRSSTDENVQLMYGPYIGRLLIETTATSVIGRLDPFRLLVLRELQSSGKHDIGRPNTLSIRWQGDVFSDGKTEWSQDRKIDQFSRAILGDCWEAFGWKPAFENFLDALAKEPKTDWIEKVNELDAAGFIPRLRKEYANLFSSFSKGIHLEFVCPPEEKFDVNTLQIAFDDAVFYSSLLAAVLNFIDHAAYCLSPEEVVKNYLAIEANWSR